MHKKGKTWFPLNQLMLPMDYITCYDVTSSLQGLLLMSTPEGPQQEGRKGGVYRVYRFQSHLKSSERNGVLSSIQKSRVYKCSASQDVGLQAPLVQISDPLLEGSSPFFYKPQWGSSLSSLWKMQLGFLWSPLGPGDWVAIVTEVA